MVAPSYIPPATQERSSFSTSLTAFAIVTIFYFRYSDRYVVISMVVLIFTFLMANNVENFFICLFYHLYVLFSEMSLHSFCPFLIGGLFISLLNFESSLYILGMNVVRYVVCKYFLPVSNFSFDLLKRVFCRENVLIFYEVQFTDFSFMDHTLGKVKKPSLSSTF